ncbi:DUF2125 domain-containing protein [Pseudooceanicola sp.]|uniref:DUF2125 domain-containing protein n=1 Tax=Pseudooceanicola sp. TaxID=1914328 RepID=UPI0026177E8E|nr:DUF2125 domain-containing protein [Pseudooceanicola sp.]MDF1854483.1 DUF2125 domain-containing protein [Pseudooceanicola sp.]
MKRLLFVILAAALFWSGYWLIGSRGAEAGFATWFEARRTEGWQADYSNLRVAGFPNRFDTTFTDLALADPTTGWAWRAPFFQLLALSYKPTQVIAVFPPQSQLSTPLDRFTLASADMRASLALDPAPRLPLNRATLIGTQIRITGTEVTELDSLTLATERLPGTDHGYRYGALAHGVRLPTPLVARLARGIALPDQIATLQLDFDGDFDRPWDLDALEHARPQVERLKLRLLKAEWGSLKLAATGELTVDGAGTPTGEIAIKAENWRDMLRVAVAAGALPESLASSVETALELAANLSGRPDTLNVTLGFSGGRIHLGPVPLGPAPVLRLR